jgi:hypothetical protein
MSRLPGKQEVAPDRPLWLAGAPGFEPRNGESVAILKPLYGAGFSAPDPAYGAGATTTGASNRLATPTLASTQPRLDAPDAGGDQPSVISGRIMGSSTYGPEQRRVTPASLTVSAERRAGFGGVAATAVVGDIKVSLPAKAITSRAKIIVHLGKAREPQLHISFLHRGNRSSATAKRRRQRGPRYLEYHQEYPNPVPITTVQADAFVPPEQRCRGEPRAVVAFAAGNAAPGCWDVSRA